MISCPIIDGSDLWALEIIENSRNKGSKKSHNRWSENNASYAVSVFRKCRPVPISTRIIYKHTAFEV